MWQPLAACAIDLDSVIANLGAPLLVFRSDDDRVVPASHADTVFALAAGPKQRIKTSGRHTATFNDPDNRQQLLAFLARHSAEAAVVNRQTPHDSP